MSSYAKATEDLPGGVRYPSQSTTPGGHGAASPKAKRRDTRAWERGVGLSKTDYPLAHFGGLGQTAAPSYSDPRSRVFALLVVAGG